MESPPSSTTWSEAFILSDDSGLLLTNSSISSGSMSGDSRSGPNRLPLEVSFHTLNAIILIINTDNLGQ